MYGPSDFEINDTWLVLKANKRPLLVQTAMYDCYVLMDAGSAYVFGQILVKQDSAPEASDITQLFDDAYAEKSQYGTRLIITELGTVERNCQEYANVCGMKTEMIPANKLLPIIGPMRESFMEMMEKRA